MDPTVDPGLRLLVAVAFLVVVPLSVVVLFRLVSDDALTGLDDHYDEHPPSRSGVREGAGLDGPAPDESHEGDAVDGPPADRHASDAVVCPQCGQPNERGYTYCRSCLGRLAG